MFTCFVFSLFFGNLFVFFVFEGKEHIDHGTRTLVFWVLSIVAICGIVVLLLLPKPKGDEDDANQEIHYGPVDAFINAMKLFATKKMLLLTVAFFYTGKEQKLVVGWFYYKSTNTCLNKIFFQL